MIDTPKEACRRAYLLATSSVLALAITSPWTGVPAMAQAPAITINSNKPTVSVNSETVAANGTDSSIVVTSGGKVTKSGVQVTGGSTLLGIVSNAGSILNPTGGAAFLLQGATANGLTNTNLISARATAVLLHSQAIFNGTISNSGTITGTSGINLSVASTLAGTINNAGTISSSRNGIKISRSAVFGGGSVGSSIVNTGLIAGTGNSGIQISYLAKFIGTITNAGTITSAGSGGIDLNNGGGFISNSAGDGILNTGLISAPTGVSVVVSGFMGTINNAGTLNSGKYGIRIAGITVYGVTGGSFNGSITNTGLINSAGFGIKAGNNANLVGMISNAGTITGGVAGIAINSFLATLSGTFAPGTITGTIVNTGLISGGLDAVYDKGRLFGTIINAGTINGARYGVALIGYNHEALNGGIINRGVIDGKNAGIDIGFSARFTGSISNAGTISGGTGAGIQLTAATVITTGGGFSSVAVFSAGSAGGGIINTGLITGGRSGIGIQHASFTGLISNAGTISGTQGPGIQLRRGAVFNGSISNNSGGLITGGETGIGIQNANFNGTISNAGTISGNIGIALSAGSVFNSGTAAGGIVNSSGGLISGRQTGILIANSTLFGAVSNAGTISGGPISVAITAATIGGGITNTGAMFALSVQRSTLGGGIVNGGTLGASGGSPNLSVVAATVGGNIVNTGLINASSGLGINLDSATVTGGLSNGGNIAGFAGIQLGSGIAHHPSTLGGTILNSGVIAVSRTGVAIAGGSMVPGGIANIGTISGGKAAINTAGFTNAAISGDGAAITIAQNAGLIQGAVLLSRVNADQFVINGGTVNGQVTGGASTTLALTNGTLVVPPTAQNNIGTFRQSGGMLVLPVTPTEAGSVTAGTLSLGGALSVVPQGSLASYLSGVRFRDVFQSGTAITGGFATIDTTTPLLIAAVVPDATTLNALDVTFSLNTAILPPLARDLTQLQQLGLETPSVLNATIENRLFTGSTYGGGGIGLFSSDKEVASAPGLLSDAGQEAGGERSGVWARGYGVVGNVAAVGGVSAYGEGRVGVIGGVDWQLTPEIALGVAGGYVNTQAAFNDGNHISLNGYEGALYGGWSDGPAYATAIAGAGVDNYNTVRQLGLFGAGVATANPTGETFSGAFETGWRFLGNGYVVAPLAGLTYVDTHVQGFSESGGFGLLTVGAGNLNSLQATLGLRASASLSLDEHGTLLPEVRLGWAHEFLNGTPTINAALATLPGSAFGATGANYGRNAAMVGLGVTHEVNRDFNMFIDYDGRLTGSLQEHAFSAGLRIKF